LPIVANRKSSLYVGTPDGRGIHSHIKYRHFIYGACKRIAVWTVCGANTQIFAAAGIYLHLFGLVNRSAPAVHVEQNVADEGTFRINRIEHNGYVMPIAVSYLLVVRGNES
jgi:hypothetical protein